MLSFRCVILRGRNFSGLRTAQQRLPPQLRHS